MATYRIIPVASTDFTAEVTYRSGRIEALHEFQTEVSALDWIGDRLGADIEPATEA